MKKQLLSGALLIGVCSIFNSSISAQESAVQSWNEIIVKSRTKSAAFITIADVNSDGKKDILMSSLMESGSPARMSSTKGALRLFTNSGNTNEGPWNEEVLISTKASLPFVNKPYAMDVNDDGIMDIVVGTGFLNTGGGSLQWMAGPDFSTLTPFTESTKKNKTGYYWHESTQFDLDGDGLKDIVTTSSKDHNSGYKVRVEWLRHLGDGNYEHHIIDETVGGVFIKHFDVDNDGDQDLVLSNFFTAPKDVSLLWLENIEAPSEANEWKGVWQRHNIDNTTGKGYNFEFIDIDMDGTLEIVYNNHNNTDNKSIVDSIGNRIPSGVYWFEFPTDPKSISQWKKHTIAEGWEIDAFDFGNPASQGSPGLISVGDLDNNGFPDVMVPGDGTDHLWVVWQLEKGVFIREKVDNGQMYGSALIDDLDDNGTLETVATMHEFPDGFFQALFNPVPYGYIKIYEPSFEAKSMKSVIQDYKVKETKEVILWPNPVIHNVNIIIPKKASANDIRVYDMSGKLIKSEIESIENEHTFKLKTENLKSGVYIIHIQGQGVVKKFIKK